MSKMRMPEMKVARFTENDVIVASGRRINVVGLGDGKSDNAAIGYGTETYFMGFPDQMATFYGVFGAANHTNIGDSTAIYFNDSTSSTLGYLKTWDSDSGGDAMDGLYEWNGTEFRHQ